MTKTPFKLRSGNSPLKQGTMSPGPSEPWKSGEWIRKHQDPKSGEVVSHTSPGPGWTKLTGTKIWSPPPKRPMAQMESRTRYTPEPTPPTNPWRKAREKYWQQKYR